MALTVIEAARLYPIELRERPGQAGGRTLTAGKQDQCAFEMPSHILTVRC